MTIILFIFILVALIVVHELGHFFVAKWFGMKVDEFGIGYPPRAWTFARRNGTEYTLNWLPFGGFVKIKGEDGPEPSSGEGSHPYGYPDALPERTAPDAAQFKERIQGDSFVDKPYWQQALVLVAGITMNIVFAWVLLSITLMVGMPRVLTDTEALTAPDAAIVISHVVEDSPAGVAGLLAGDKIERAIAGDTPFTGHATEAFVAFVGERDGVPVTLFIKRGSENLMLSAIPHAGTIAEKPERAVLGVGIATVGTVPVSPLEAPIEGAKLTWSMTQQVAVGLVHFFAGLFTFTADLSQVSGPLGIAGAVGDASASGIIALLMLTAVISINLALINLIPIPALDGGRLLFVLIEWVTRRRIPAGIAGAVNGIGFVFLILLMVIVTASDIWKAFS